MQWTFTNVGLFGLVGEYVPCDSYGNGYHQALEPDRLEDVCTEEERGPQKGEDVCLDAARNDLVLAEVLDVAPEVGMVHQPVVHAVRTTVVAVGGKQYQWRGGQHRQEDADDA